MTKQPKIITPHYSKAERKAENTIDTFLAGVNSLSTASVLEDLKKLSRS